jgi:hypothetical protein
MTNNAAADWTIRSSNSCKDKGLFPYPKTSRPVLRFTQFPTEFVPEFFSGIKRLEGDADHSPPSKAGVKNE